MARFSGGWIKVHKSLLDGDIPQHGGYTLAVWIKILAWAAWREAAAFFDGQQIRLQPGQLITGLADLAWREEDPYLHRVRSSLDYLQKTDRIAQTVSTRGRLITVINWAGYQASDEDGTGESANAPQTERKRSATYEEVKKRRINTNTAGYPAEFEGVYKKYPRREGKTPGFKTYSKLIKSDEDRARLEMAIANYSRQKRGTEKRYLLQFSTFMNQWTDWLPENPIPLEPVFRTAEQIEAESA